MNNGEPTVLPSLPVEMGAFSIESITNATFLVIFLVYIIFSIIFAYHCNAYGTDKKVTTYTFIVYLATTVPLIIILGILALFI